MKSLIWLLVLANAIHVWGEQAALSKYKVNYENTAIPINIAKEFVGLSSEDGVFEIVNVNRETNKQDYLCYLPKDKTVYSTEDHTYQSIPSDAGNSTDNQLIENAVRAVNLSFSKEDCFIEIGMNGGYWTYGYCFGDKIIQFHENVEHFLRTKEHKPESPDYVFVLGRFKGAPRTKATMKNQSKGRTDNPLKIGDFSVEENIVDQFSDAGTAVQYSSQKFVQHTLHNGGICDLTQEPRSVDVIYKCDPSNRRGVQILEVQEHKTCKYSMVIHVPKLCEFKEFRPNSIEDKVTSVSCKAIDSTNQEPSRQVKKEDFDSYQDRANEKRFFLTDSNYKINLADYHMSPCGYGFSFATKKQQSATPDWSSKHLLLFNGNYESVKELLSQVAGMFQKVLDRKVFSPVFVGKDTVSTLQWTDSFIVWYELFDFYGNFKYYVRIFRDGIEKGRALELQVIDPHTMLDQDGDKVEIPEFDAPNFQLNFERFYRPTIVDDSSSIGVDEAAAKKPADLPQVDISRKEIMDTILEEIKKGNMKVLENYLHIFLPDENEELPDDLPEARDEGFPNTGLQNDEL